ncbi:hypothetical protein [Sphingomonas bacterium]|uniref:hypothetical protein n=1 Tax=Sphingomonas bacterium TaxID=1895847 RepID=UPI0015772B00|nr:hypothetical protein [Sphingomonas bacterium]
MLRPTLILALLALPTIAQAQSQSESQAGQPPQRVRNIQLRPGEKCPPAGAGEVIVCGTLDQPYRIPKALRDDKPIPAQNQSWAARTETADEIGRVAGGLPDTCSPIGSGGQTGCALQANKAWVAEKTAERRAASSIP